MSSSLFAADYGNPFWFAQSATWTARTERLKITIRRKLWGAGTMSSYAAALSEFYNGEVYGEALFSALAGLAQNADEHFKWSMLLQLETETKAWLRVHMIAHGVTVEERTEDRESGCSRARDRASQPWPQAMQSMQENLSRHLVPLYQSFADAAQARGNADEKAVCLYMVEHEKALIAFARRELAGARMADSLEPIMHFLRYPIALPATH